MSDNYLTLEFTTKSPNKLEVTLLECSLSPAMQHQLPSSVFISNNTFAIGANVLNDVSIILPTSVEEKRFSTKLRLALRFTDINDYLFVYIDDMEGDFYKLPKYIDSGFTFSRSSPDRFYITDFTESDEIHVVFPFNNEYMSRVCIHECAGKLSPRELEEKIVYMLSNKVFKPENQVAIDQDDTKEGWRSYKWVAYI